jgi:hypothetical protein
VEVMRREEAVGTCVDPARLGEGLALGAMPVAAGIASGPFQAAVSAHVEVSAERFGATPLDVLQSAKLDGGKVVRAAKLAAMETHHFGDLRRRSCCRAHDGARDHGHVSLGRGAWSCAMRALALSVLHELQERRGALEQLCAHVQVDGCAC